MAFTIVAGVITQTGTDTSLAGLVGLAGVTANTSPNGVRFYLVDATVTLININGTLSWNSDSECLVLSESTRVEQNAPATVTIGVVATVNGKTRYSRGTGLVINRANSGLNTSGTSWWMKSSASLALGSKLIVNGGQIKTRGSIFLGTTTNPPNQFATIELNGRAEVLNLATAAVQVIRSFVQPSGIQLVSGVLSGRTFNSSVFSSVGFGTLAVEADFASFQCDGNGPKNPVTVDNGVFADNKSQTDYTYVTFGNLLANINKYIFRNPDVGSALRTIGASAGAWRQGVVEINKDVRFEVVDSSNAPIEGAATYIKMLGASINPSGRYAGVDDYITPRAYVGETNASGLTTAANILYAVAQGYATNATGAGTPLTMESLTTRAGDVQDGYIWSYGHLLGPTAVPMRGVNQLTVGWTLFADPNVTLSRSAAAALTTITTLSDFYDAAKFWKTRPIRAQLEFPTPSTLVISANGDVLDLGSRNLVIDGTALTAFATNTGTNTITIRASNLTAGAKYKTIRTTGTISTANGATTSGIVLIDSSGTQVALTNRNGVIMTSYVLINGTPVGGSTVDGVFAPGFVPLVMSRTLTVQTADVVRMVVNAYGYKPQVVNCTGAELDKFTVTLELETGVDTTVSTVTRDAVAATLGFIQASPTQIDITVNQTLVSYAPKEAVVGIAYAIVSRGFLVFAAIAQANNANVYSLSGGQLVSYLPNFKLRMNDTDSGGAAIVPTAAGYSVPLVAYYFDQATSTASPVTILNASNAKIETAPWTQATATISEQDKQAIANISAVETWEYSNRTINNALFT